MSYYSRWVWFRCLGCGKAFRAWFESVNHARCSYCNSREYHTWDDFLDLVSHRHPDYPPTPILGKYYRMR